MDKTIRYYDEHADSFAAGTINVDFSAAQDRFLSFLPKDGRILDFGCGSGRDSKYFLEKGFQVDAMDGSEKMCRIARQNTGLPVRQMLFSELDAEAVYDGIWACASILHLPKSELRNVLLNIAGALKSGGYCYTSFKYGEFEGERNGRHFTDFTEKTFENFLTELNKLTIADEWISSDVRPGRAEEKWLNVIMRYKC